MTPPPAFPRRVPVNDTDPFRPSRLRPVRVRSRALPADSHFEPHRHAWGQLAYCASGTVQVRAATAGCGDITYIVPPSRAVWIAPGALHSVRVLEDAELRTLYVHAPAMPTSWGECRVLVVSPLLRELILSLDALASTRGGSPRESLLTALLLDEMQLADTQPLGVPLPSADSGDKRLRALCDAVLRAPGARATLAQWASKVGASERTLARLFREELGTSYQQWRQQVVLARALPLLAAGTPVGEVAASTGYRSESGFTAMFKAAMGQSPRHFQGRGATAGRAALSD